MKREYCTKDTIDMIWCQTLLDEMWEKWWELVCTQRAGTCGEASLILRIFKRPINYNGKMTDSEQQVMQFTQDLYVLKHTVIAWKTVEERIKESNIVPEDAMIKDED